MFFGTCFSQESKIILSYSILLEYVPPDIYKLYVFDFSSIK